MEWINIKNALPIDDEIVLCIHEKIQMLPIKSYYCETWNTFMSLESDSNVPLNITHWMKIPKLEKV